MTKKIFPFAVLLLVCSFIFCSGILEALTPQGQALLDRVKVRMEQKEARKAQPAPTPELIPTRPPEPIVVTPDPIVVTPPPPILSPVPVKPAAPVAAAQPVQVSEPVKMGKPAATPKPLKMPEPVKSVVPKPAPAGKPQPARTPVVPATVQEQKRPAPAARPQVKVAPQPPQLVVVPAARETPAPVTPLETTVNTKDFRLFGEVSDEELIEYAMEHVWHPTKSKKHHPPVTPPSKSSKKKSKTEKKKKAAK